jgi:hypothetical protein
MASVCVLLIVTGYGHAQTTRLARLSGTVRTPAGPATGIELRAGLGTSVKTDTGGAYEFPSLPTSKQLIRVFCPSASYWHAQELARFEVTLPQGADSVHDLMVDRALCTERVDTLRGIFRGHWSVGFEESEFLPCPGTVKVNGWSLRSGWGGIWGEWGRTGVSPWPQKMPRPDTSGYGDRYYIRALGTLHGPGDFGHLGVAAYQLEIDSLLEVRTPSEKDCK